jgi:EAL domain-containing protein (putative c-di-GMP-specific phosphodiesterase class I)
LVRVITEQTDADAAMLRLNVSPIQLADNGFVRTAANVIEAFGIDAGAVCLEITERVVVSDVEKTKRTLASLKEVGPRSR